MKAAKVFRKGRRQAIRLPEEFHVDRDEVYLKKTPEGFLVISRDPWEIFLEGVQALPADFMSEGREQLRIQSKRPAQINRHL
jgi:virulence-associated protein VagC